MPVPPIAGPISGEGKSTSPGAQALNPCAPLDSVLSSILHIQIMAGDNLLDAAASFE